MNKQDFKKPSQLFKRQGVVGILEWRRLLNPFNPFLIPTHNSEKRFWMLRLVQLRFYVVLFYI